LTIERILKDAALVGPSTEVFCVRVLEERAHPEQGFRTCLGIVRMGKRYGVERLEGACLRALQIGALNYGSVKSILDNHLDGQTTPKRRRVDDDQTLDLPHLNLRGSTYYH
jgi:transposase